MNKEISVLAAALVALSVSGGAAACEASDPSCLVEWETTGAAGNETTLASTAAATDINGASLSRGSGLNASAASNNFGSSNWTGASNDYFSFGFTVASGYTASLSALDIATKSSATGPGTMALYYSGDGFTNALYTFNQVAASTNYLDSIVNLGSIAALQNLQGTVTFEIKQVGTGSDNGGTTSSAGTFRIGDYYNGSAYSAMAFDGTVASLASPAPEPDTMSLALVGLAGVGFAARRRRAK